MIAVEFLVIIIVAVAHPLYTLPTTFTKETFQECLTPACVAAADNARQLMDPTIDPCDNFYDYACGRFMNEVDIPSKDGMLLPSISDTLSSVQRNLLELILEPIETNDTKPIAMAKQYFADCMDMEAREIVGLGPLKEFIEKIGGWPLLGQTTQKNPIGKWWQLAEQFAAEGLDGNWLFGIQIEEDLRQPNQRIIYITPSQFSSLAFEPGTQYISGVAEQLGAATGAGLTYEISLMLGFIDELITIQRSFQALEPEEFYNPLILSDLQKLHPYVNWTNYINSQLPPSVQVNSTERVIVMSSEGLQRLGQLIDRTPDRVVANLMVFKAVENLIPFTNLKMLKLANNYLASVVGSSAMAPHHEICLEATKENIPVVLDAMYVRRHFDVAARDYVDEMVTSVRQLMAENLWSSVEWMDKITKKRAEQKLGGIIQVIGYKEQLLDNQKLDNVYVNLDLHNLTFFAATQRLMAWERFEKLSKLNRPVDLSEDWTDFSMSSSVNAYFAPNKNLIFIPAAFLQHNIFSVDRPNYMNFATIGTVIGHELNHGFDSTGRQFDDRGNLTDWWEPETARLYQERATCLNKQYATFIEPLTRQPLNTIITQGEDISDNGGVHLLYKTYKKWVANNPIEPSLPGLDLTPNQLFWLSYGQLWCGKTRTEFAVYSRENDPHSPYRFRVLGPLRNSQDFSDDFACPIGSPMNPDEKCSLW